MTVEGDQGRWLLAKARQLKERALGTADRTRRKQFLLIATEYQKLARFDASIDSAIDLNASSRNIFRGSARGQIALLRADSVPAAQVHAETRIEASEQVRQRDRWINLLVLAIISVFAFALVLIPGDQTMGGLHTIAAMFFN